MRRKIPSVAAAGFLLATIIWIGCMIRRHALVQADYIAVWKGDRKMVLYARGKPLHTYQIVLGKNPVGPKYYEGDNRTPEGRYMISARNAKSDYHLSLRISYPSEEDIARARVAGRSTGGDIMIHGLPNGTPNGSLSQFQNDWTAGCIAVSNPEIEEIWRKVPTGTPIDIYP